MAADVLAGRDPRQVIAVQLEALRTFDSQTAGALAHEHFTLARATLVKLKSQPGKRGGALAAPAPRAIHDPGLRRDPPDPADAIRPSRVHRSCGRG